MNGRIPGFKFNPKKHLAHFSLYIPKSGGKLRRERTVRAATREEALHLWQVFRDEISGKPTSAPPAEPPVMSFKTFIDTHLEKICARRAKKTLAIYRTIAMSRLIPAFGDKPLNAIRANDNLIVGGQSGSDRILQTSGRGHTVQDIRNAVATCIEVGFRPNIDFIFGMPGEEAVDIHASLDLVEELTDMGARIHGHTFMPLPGTPFVNEKPGTIDREAMRRLQAMTSTKKLYGQWTQQIGVARELAALRRKSRGRRQSAPPSRPG